MQKHERLVVGVRDLRALRPDLPVLYVSGYTGDRIDKLDLDDENTSYLQKPFTVGQLREMVERILGGRNG